MADYPKTKLKEVQDAWIKVLADFRAWFKPETEHSYAWKMRPFSQAIAGAKGSLVDDAESLLAEWRKNTNAEVETGKTAFIPVMLTAIAPIQAPPDVSQIVGIPYWIEAAVGDTKVQLRTIKTAIRAQVVYFSTNPHDAKSVSDQFCAYFDDDFKRRFEVDYLIGDTEKVKFKMTVQDNSLFPDNIQSEAKNLSIISVDVTMVGVMPHVLGLGGQWDNVTDNGFNPKTGAMGGDNGGQNTHINDVVEQVDTYSDTPQHWRITGDWDTEQSSIDKID